jgi:hypothetical protein
MLKNRIFLGDRMSIEQGSSLGGIWHVVGARQSDNFQITARLFQADTPSREGCARALLGVLNSQGIASPPVIRGFGDIALLRVFGYEIVSVERFSDDDLSRSNIPMPARQASTLGAGV